MAKRVNLDAMIPRADFAVADEDNTLDLIRDFPITHLASDSPILKLLRKPDFQRETNHWSPEQVATFVASFVDNEVIPSLILWKNPTYIFVIDGGHRLSALRAWMEDDYGDGALSLSFYGGEISDEQKRVARRTRQMIEERIGRFSKLRSQVDSKLIDLTTRRAKTLFMRGLTLQWVQGNADVAETSFYKINSQGTPLDETEEMLIRYRRKPIAIGARAILRAGGGHKYWSQFGESRKLEIESIAGKIHDLLFEPEADTPLKTLDVPFGGSVSPVDALGLLIEFLGVAGNRKQEAKAIDKYDDDDSGESSIAVLKNSLHVLNRMTGNSPGSLGLHPAVYFYNEKGKYSRFLFLGMSALITDKIRDNDSGFFKAFTEVRSQIERFLIDNKSLIGILLQNMAKAQRIPKMRDMFDFLVTEFQAGTQVTVEALILKLGLKGRIVDVTAIQTTPHISEDTKSMVFVRDAIKSALRCPICGGLLDAGKSVSYDHKVRVQDGGCGDVDNTQLAHPYCNTGFKESLAAKSGTVN